MQILYLHGLASSPHSAKALFFQQTLSKLGHRLVIPDLNVPSFEQLSFKAILDRATATLAELGDGPLGVMGSSLGGLAALHLLMQRSDKVAQVSKLVLLAPALDFRHNKRLTPAVVASWRSAGSIPLHHSATNTERLLSYSFHAELEALPTVRPPSIPTLLLHGRMDEVLGIEHSRAFAAGNKNIDFIEVESDHSLISAFDALTPIVEGFLPSGLA